VDLNQILLCIEGHDNALQALLLGTKKKEGKRGRERTFPICYRCAMQRPAAALPSWCDRMNLIVVMDVDAISPRAAKIFTGICSRGMRGGDGGRLWIGRFRAANTTYDYVVLCTSAGRKLGGLLLSRR